MPEATEQGSHPNPKPATQSQAGASGNRSGSRGGRAVGHKATNRPQHQESHQHRHGGSRRPPPGIGTEDHGRGSHHGRNHDAGGNHRHSDSSSQTAGKRDQRSAPQGDASSARAHQQFHSNSQSTRPSERAQTPPRGKPPGQPQMAAKFLPPSEQKSQVTLVESDGKVISSSPPASLPIEAFENPPSEPTFADPSIVEQKEAGPPLSVEEQQRHAQQLHIQMQQQQFIQQLALAQQLYFQQFQQQAVHRMAAMMAAQQLQRQQQEEPVSQQSEEERLSNAIPEKDPAGEHAVDRQDESVAAKETQTRSLPIHVQSESVMPMPGSHQQLVSEEVSEEELARHLDMLMKEQGLVRGNDLTGKATDSFLLRGPAEGQQFYEVASRNPNGSEVPHPTYTQEQSMYNAVDPQIPVTSAPVINASASEMSMLSHINPSFDQSFFTQPLPSTDIAISASPLMGTTGPLNPRPPVDDELAMQFQGSHSYSTSPPLQPTTTPGYNGQSNPLALDFGHEPTGHPFTGFSDHSSEHSWLGDGEPQFASLATEPTGFEAVNPTRSVGRGTDAPAQPDARRQQRKSGSHKPTPSQVTLEVGGRMFFVYPATFQPYPDSLLNQVLNGSNPVKLNERQAIAFDRDGFIFDILLAFCRTGRLTIPPTVRLASVLDEAKYFRLDKYLFDPKFARPPRYHLLFKRETVCRLAMKREQGCQMNCLFVVRGDDQLIVKEIKESSMRLLVDVTTEAGDTKAKDYVVHDPLYPKPPLPSLRSGHIYSFHLGLPSDISRGVPMPTMEVVFQELVMFSDKEQLINISSSDRD